MSSLKFDNGVWSKMMFSVPEKRSIKNDDLITFIGLRAAHRFVLRKFPHMTFVKIFDDLIFESIDPLFGRDINIPEAIKKYSTVGLIKAVAFMGRSSRGADVIIFNHNNICVPPYRQSEPNTKLADYFILSANNSKKLENLARYGVPSPDEPHKKSIDMQIAEKARITSFLS